MLLLETLSGALAPERWDENLMKEKETKGRKLVIFFPPFNKTIGKNLDWNAYLQTRKREQEFTITWTWSLVELWWLFVDCWINCSPSMRSSITAMN